MNENNLMNNHSNYDDHLEFCKKFLSEKKFTFSPRITVRSNEEKKNVPFKIPLNEEEGPSKLFRLKNLVIKAIDHNNQQPKEQTEYSKKVLTTPFGSREESPQTTKVFKVFNDFSKMPPILHNNIKMFINKIRRIGYLNDLSVLKPYDLKIINDQVYFEPEEIQNNSKINKISSFFFKQIFKISPFLRKIICSRLEVIHPYNTYKLLWDLQISLMIILLIFYIPLSLSFDLNLISNEIYSGISILLLIDMFLEMNTLYFHYGVEMRNRKQIMTHYFRTYFFWDLFSTI